MSGENLKHSTEEGFDEESLKETQSPRVTPNEDHSSNEDSSEDLSAEPSANCSPQLTPNTTQGWTAWGKLGIDSSSLQSEDVPVEDTLKNSNLEGMTHDFLHENLEKETGGAKPDVESLPGEKSLPGEENEGQHDGR